MKKPAVRNWDWLSVSLVFLLVQVTAARLVTTNWAPFLYFSETIAALGTILGLALGASSYSRRVVGLLVIAYTAFILTWQMTAPLHNNLFLDRLTNIGRIISASFIQFLQRKPVTDSLFFVAFICFVFWLISITAGYWLVRHDNILVTILPAYIAIILVQLYDNYRAVASWWLAVFMLVLLLLLGRNYYLQNQRGWTKRRVFISEESWPNIFGGLFSILAVAVVIAWLIPTSLTSLQSASNSWSSFTKPLIDRLSNAVSSLNGPFGKANGNYYGATLGLGREAGQGDATVFTVKLLNQPDFNSRYYWRARVYDTYNNGQWSSSPASNLAFQPDKGDLKIPDSEYRSEASLQFTIQFLTQNLIYAPSQPVWVDRSGSVVATLTDTKLIDIMTWQATSAILAGGNYQVRSELIDPNVQQLRSAGSQYPVWVTDRYLGIPDNIRVKIKDLADQVSGSQDTPYDKAQAITNYLRANIEYVTTVPEPPVFQDPVSWVLFYYKKGFCNYYASAEVLMLRSVGVPARLAVGFAQGQYQTGEFVVRQRDAHAWPEVYFPGIGWVEFEPTVSQDALVRPNTLPQATRPISGSLQPPQKPIGELDGTPTENSGSIIKTKILPFPQTVPGRVLFIASYFLLASLAIFLLRRNRVITNLPNYLSRTLEKGGFTPPRWIENWVRWNQADPVEHFFAAINWSLDQLHNPQLMDATPAERSKLLKELLPKAAEDIDNLMYEFESGLFTKRSPDLSRALRSCISIVLYTIRFRIHNFLDAMDGGDVYSR